MMEKQSELNFSRIKSCDIKLSISSLVNISTMEIQVYVICDPADAPRVERLKTSNEKPIFK